MPLPGFFPKLLGGEPITHYARPSVFAKIFNILLETKGLGCRIIRDPAGWGWNWIISVDGSSDLPLPPGFELPWNALAAPKPFDYLKHETALNRFSIRGDGAEYMLWRAGPRVPLANIGTSGFTFNAVSGNWDITAVVSATTYVYIELDRLAVAPSDIATIYAAASIPDGTAAKYDSIEIFPLWRLNYDAGNTAISDRLDLRESMHLPAMA